MAKKKKRKIRHADDDTTKMTSKPKKEKLSSDDKVAYERELRRYVKSSGGFRKDLPKLKQEKAVKIMKVLGRKSVEWDKSIVVPGLDKPTVKGMVIVD